MSTIGFWYREAIFMWTTALQYQIWYYSHRQNWQLLHIYCIQIAIFSSVGMLHIFERCSVFQNRVKLLTSLWKWAFDSLKPDIKGLIMRQLFPVKTYKAPRRLNVSREMAIRPINLSSLTWITRGSSQENLTWIHFLASLQAYKGTKVRLACLASPKGTNPPHKGFATQLITSCPGVLRNRTTGSHLSRVSMHYWLPYNPDENIQWAMPLD